MLKSTRQKTKKKNTQRKNWQNKVGSVQIVKFLVIACVIQATRQDVASEENYPNNDCSID
jgi:hypothetical protein